MIRKYRYGTPFDTEALTEKIETTKGVLPYGEVSQEEGFVFTYIMDEDDIVYGLVKPIVESTREGTVISVIVQMIRYTQRTSVLCTEPITSLL